MELCSVKVYQPVCLVKMLSHIGVDVLTVHLHQVMEKELGSKIL